MALASISSVTGRGVYVAGDDIDTDRIIPARFMKCVTFDGLGEYFFYDVRKDADGNDRKHNLNDERFKGASVLLTGNNFGCGSSREHAPQALQKAGFRAVIAEGFAEIFFGNSIQLGIPCVTASKADIRKVVDAIEADPQTTITVDVERSEVRYGAATIPCTIRPGSRQALLAGEWDPLAQLLANTAEVDTRLCALGYAGKV